MRVPSLWMRPSLSGARRWGHVSCKSSRCSSWLFSVHSQMKCPVGCSAQPVAGEPQPRQCAGWRHGTLRRAAAQTVIYESDLCCPSPSPPPARSTLTSLAAATPPGSCPAAAARWGGQHAGCPGSRPGTCGCKRTMQWAMMNHSEKGGGCVSGAARAPGRWGARLLRA